MSILALQKATLIGISEDRATMLDALQSLGVLHVISLAEPSRKLPAIQHSLSPERLLGVLHDLLDCKQKRKQVLSERHFDLSTVVAAAEKIVSSGCGFRSGRSFCVSGLKTLLPGGISICQVITA